MAQAATETTPKTPKGPVQKLPDIAAGSVKQALAAAEAGKQTLTLLNPDAIHIYPGLQPRYDNTAYRTRLDDLIESMKEGGYMMSKPISVWVGKNEAGEDTIYVVDGHTRLTAAKQAIDAGADIPQIPSIVLPSKTTMEQIIAMTVRENENPGQKLDPLEKALSIKRLMNRGIKEDEIMRLLGFGKKWFDQIVLLIEAPKFIRDAIKNGKIAGTLALGIIVEQFRVHAKKIEKDPVKGKKAAYEIAEKEIRESIETAGKAGRARATQRDTSKGTRGGKSTRKTETDSETGEQRVRMVTDHTAAVGMPAGTEFKLSEWRPWTLLFGTEWYTLHEDRAGYAITVEDVEFNASFKHPERAAPDKKDEAAEEAADEAETEGEEDEAGEGGEGEEEGELEHAAL